MDLGKRESRLEKTKRGERERERGRTSKEAIKGGKRVSNVIDSWYELSGHGMLTNCTEIDAEYMYLAKRMTNKIKIITT